MVKISIELRLVTIILGILVISSLIFLPIVWENAIKPGKAKLMTFTRGNSCTDAKFCRSCVEQSGERWCKEGVCDHTGACLVPAEIPNITLLPNEPWSIVQAP